MLDRRIKIRHVQCLSEINRRGSLKRAAERLGLTQPAMSRTLKELEEIAGTTLMTRGRSGVALTTAGETFLHFAEMSLASLEQGLQSIARGAPGRLALSVGALPSVAAHLLPEAAARFGEAAPEVTLRIFDGPHGYLTEEMRRGALDLVIGRLGQGVSLRGISFTHLYSERVVFVVRPGHPLLEAPALERLGDWPVIFPTEAAAIRPLVERFLIANGVGDLDRRIETVSGAFGRVYVPQSDAVWIISNGVVANELRAGRLALLPFETGLTLGPVGFMARPDAVPPPAEAAFRLAVTQAVTALGLGA